jgi:hypothetical protein
MSDTGVLVTIEDEDDARVVLDYTNRDFVAIRAQLVGLAKGLMPDWSTAGEASDFGTLLLELFAYMGDVMHFYIDRTASEAFLGTAVRRQSVLYIADMLGYRPIGQQSASVELEFAIDSNAEAAITIPVNTRVYNDTDNASNLIVFETSTEVTLDPLATPPILTGTAFASEGITIDGALLGISLGIPNLEFILPHKGVVFNTVHVRSDEAGQSLPWNFVSDISLARPTQAAFTTFLDDEGSTHLIFGDNASGRIPPANANLYVGYRYGQGAEANDLAPNSISVIAANSVPSTVDLWGVTVRNPESPVGGTDPESVDAMRFSIPRAASRIKSRAITLNDYGDLAMQVPGVAKSVAYGTVYTAVHVVLAPTDGKATTEYMEYLCASVENYMADKIIVGSTVYAEPDDVNDLWSHVHIRVLVHVIDGYNRTSVRLQVEALIRKALEFDLVDFGTRVSIGKIYRTSLSVQGVEWIELMWLSNTAPTLAQDKLMAPITNNPDPNPITVTDLATPPLLIPRIVPPMTVFKTALVQTKQLTSWVAKLTTTLAHNFLVGEGITVAGVDGTFNGNYIITAVTSNTISYAKQVADIVAVAATGTITQYDTHSPEAETDFPGLDENERTHDGLWVWAVGGVVGT